MPPIHLKFKSSNHLFMIITALHLGAALSIILTGAQDFKYLIVFVLGSHWLFVSRKYVWLVTQNSLLSLQEDAQGHFILINRKGLALPVKFHGLSLRTNFLIILNFKHLALYKKYSIPIFKDTIGPENFRRLMVNLLCFEQKARS